MCTCGCKNTMCPCMDLHVVLKVKCAEHLWFACMHSSLASQTPTAQNLVSKCLSIVQEDGCELFLLFGCWFCSTWSWVAGVLGVWSLDRCLVLKQLQLRCRGHVSFSHMHRFVPSRIQTKFGSILYVDRCKDWTQDVSIEPLFVCTSGRKWQGSWTHQIVWSASALSSPTHKMTLPVKSPLECVLLRWWLYFFLLASLCDGQQPH